MQLAGLTVAECMTVDLLTVGPDEDVTAAVEKMLARDVTPEIPVQGSVGASGKA